MRRETGNNERKQDRYLKGNTTSLPVMREEKGLLTFFFCVKNGKQSLITSNETEKHGSKLFKDRYLIENTTSLPVMRQEKGLKCS